MQSGTLRLHDNLPSDRLQSLLHENVRKKATFSPIALCSVGCGGRHEADCDESRVIHWVHCGAPRRGRSGACRFLAISAQEATSEEGRAAAFYRGLIVITPTGAGSFGFFLKFKEVGIPAAYWPDPMSTTTGL